MLCRGFGKAGMPGLQVTQKAQNYSMQVKAETYSFKTVYKLFR